MLMFNQQHNTLMLLKLLLDICTKLITSDYVTLTLDTHPSSIVESSGLENVRVYLTGQNLWTYAPHYVGLDPEVGVGVGESSDGEFGTFSIFGIPILKSLQFGIDIKF